ncbi:MAG: serine protease [Patescibacteria group bacterium]
MKHALIFYIILAGGFFLFSNNITYRITFEQPAVPEKIIILPPEKLEAVQIPPPPPSEPITQPAPPKPATTILLPPPPNPIAQSELYAKGLLATVNFLCPNKDGTYAVATGALIDSHGYIVSNAHIVEESNQQIICTIRAGSPAIEIGKVKLVLMSAEYFATTDEQTKARMDISLWKLEGVRTDWPYWEIDFDTTPKVGEQLFTQSYPAELLSSEIVFKNLNLLFSNTVVSETDTSFIASRATIAAQHGSSGGILIDPYTGKLRGIIFGISSDANKAINERVLYAITPSRINALAWQETKKQFREYLSALPEPAY